MTQPTQMKRHAVVFLRRKEGAREEVLLQSRSSGIFAKAWEGLGGRFKENGEKVSQCVGRVVEKDSDLALKGFVRHGQIDVFSYDMSEVWRVLIFSSDNFSGKLKSANGNNLMWFPARALPYGEMPRINEEFILPAVLRKGKIEGTIYMRNSRMTEFKEFSLNLRR